MCRRERVWGAGGESGRDAMSQSGGQQWPADKVERRSVATLIPYARNSRTHSDEQVGQIAASIREWGWTTPVLVDEEGTIIAGHGRVMAAHRLGIDEVPCVVATGWTDAQKRAYVIADNKLASNAGWDDEMLKVELGELQALDFDLGLTGFGEEELAGLLEERTDGLTDPDDVPDVPGEPRTKPGDLWLLDEHRVLCGDSTSKDDVALLMDGKAADMVLTDPPYGVSYVGKTKDALKVENDALDESELAILIRDAFGHAESACRGGAYWYATVPPGPLLILFADDLKRRGILRQIMVWAKDAMVLGHSEYHYQHELILFGWMAGERHKNSDRTRTTLWRYDRPKANREHPTMKPVDLWKQAVTDGSRAGEVVYDPFLGSGTTLIAAEQLGRTCYGMEISPAYCDVIVRRWQDFTGKDATLASSGEKF